MNARVSLQIKVILTLIVSMFIIQTMGLFQELELGNSTSSKLQRDGKLLSFVNVVRFDNVICPGTARVGICYTADECAIRGGRSTNTCAQGFGVCCIFSLGCGTTSKENVTYFEPTGMIEPGSCTLSVCPSKSNVCQLRLDFLSFVITGPSTQTEDIGVFQGGQVTPSGENTIRYSAATQCLTDTFSVTSSSGTRPPTICGVNTGDHMFVDAGDGCNDLVFQIGSVARGNVIPARQWNIRILQYSCDYNNLAPPGCTQYIFGVDSGLVQSYNYANGGSRHLADQQQVICIRREQNKCRICWSTTMSSDFSVSGVTTSRGIVDPNICCAYNGDAISERQGYDCLTIPGAVKNTALTPVPETICGRRGLVIADGRDYVTICSVTEPFQLRFNSDSYEVTNDGGTENRDVEGFGANPGFRLSYVLSSNNCA